MIFNDIFRIFPDVRTGLDFGGDTIFPATNPGHPTN